MARNSVTRLPSNATLPQRLLAATEAARADLIDPAIDELWDPLTCPAEFLPWLAWALSVDVWNEGWPEETRRKVIAASPMVHRLKGTKAAVVRALEALNLRPVITEWWEQAPNGRRGTFLIDVLVNVQIFDDEPDLLNGRIQADAIAVVRASRPKSRYFDFRLGVGYEGSLQVASALTGLTAERVAALAEPECDERGSVALASAVAAMSVDRDRATAQPECFETGAVRLAATATSLAVDRARYEVA